MNIIKRIRKFAVSITISPFIWQIKCQRYTDGLDMILFAFGPFELTIYYDEE